MENRYINTTHISKYVEDRRELNTIVQLISRTSTSTTCKSVILERVNGRTGGVYYCTERELRHFKIDDNVFKAIDKYEKHRRGCNVDTDYQKIREVLRKVLEDIEKYEDKIPDTTDEWEKYRNEIEPKVHIGKRDPKAINVKKNKRKEFSKKFKKVMKW